MPDDAKATASTPTVPATAKTEVTAVKVESFTVMKEDGICTGEKTFAKGDTLLSTDTNEFQLGHLIKDGAVEAK